MFPLYDENPTHHLTFITLLLIAANAAAWVLIQDMGFYGHEKRRRSLCSARRRIYSGMRADIFLQKATKDYPAIPTSMELVETVI